MNLNQCHLSEPREHVQLLSNGLHLFIKFLLKVSQAHNVILDNRNRNKALVRSNCRKGLRFVPSRMQNAMLRLRPNKR